MLGTKPNTMDHTFATCFDVRSALPLFVGGDLEIEELRAVESTSRLARAARSTNSVPGPPAPS